MKLTSALPLPVVLWHGLGDSANGMAHVASVIEQTRPGTFVHVVSLPLDREAALFGNVDEQLATVCAQLSELPQFAEGYDAIGFSQGGLFLRAVAERCPSPAMRKLITFGSPHNGFTDLPDCNDTRCRMFTSWLRNNMWSGWVQRAIVPAQYFRDPEHLRDYRLHSGFLADINNERSQKNTTYALNLVRLEEFIMVMFADDTVLIPKESAWFAERNQTTGEVTPLEHRQIFREDWIGLRLLNKHGSIRYIVLPGQHLAISDNALRQIIAQHLDDPEGLRMPSVMVQ